MRAHSARASVPIILVLAAGLLAVSQAPSAHADHEDVAIVSPDGGGILDGTVLLQANVTSHDPAAVGAVEFKYRAHENEGAPTSLGFASLDPGSGLWVLEWDTTTVADTANTLPDDTAHPADADSDPDQVNITKPPTHDQLSVEAVIGGELYEDAIDIRVQNMLTTRFTLPDNQEDLRGFQDLEVLLSSQHEVTGVRFDLYTMDQADPRILTPFGEFTSLGTPIENAHYGRPLGDPDFPTGDPAHAIGPATPEGSQRWVLRGWDTTEIPDGTWLLVARAQDAGGRTATYMVETYIVNDLKVQITAPTNRDADQTLADPEPVSGFVALEARTSSLTGADNAAPGSLWPATGVEFTFDGPAAAPPISATEIPEGSGRWRAVWDANSLAPGVYELTATATNANPGGAEVVSDVVHVDVSAPGAELEADFPFDWSNCFLTECSFLDGSDGAPNWWLWDFGDGTTSDEQLPTHTYAEPGVYTVTLTVSNDGGTTTESISKRIPVGNTPVVSFNRNNLDIEGETEFIDWTSAFKDFDYTVGETLYIPAMWETTVGHADFLTIANEVCDADEETPNQECVIFTPEEADGTAPHSVEAADDGVLFGMEFTEVQHRGVTDIFKGKANIRVGVGIDLDGNPDTYEQENMLGTNVDVTNSGVEGDENRTVKIFSPSEGQFVAGNVPVRASTVSTVAADQVEFFIRPAGTTGEPASLGVDSDGSNGWATGWNTLAQEEGADSYPDGAYELTAVATLGDQTTTSAVRTVNVENTAPAEPDAPGSTFQTGRTSDTLNQFLTFRHEIAEGEDDGQGGPPPAEGLKIPGAKMSADFSALDVIEGGGVIGGDALEFDVTITNTSTDPGIVLSAFAFQSKVSESPALASRIGDKAFYGTVVPGTLETTADSALGTVKKNGTSQGLLPGQWKGICINSSKDFIPEFNSGLEDESLECGGNRADTNADGDPELQTGADMLGLRPGESQTVRIRIDSGTTDGALHVVERGTLQGQVEAVETTGPNGQTYYVPNIVDPADPADPAETNNVISIPDFGDNKVLRNADGTFNPTFAPEDSDGAGPDVGFDFAEQQYLTLPRKNHAFTDLLGRNHTCANYGLTIGECGGTARSPFIHLLGSGDLVPGVQNFAAILRGFGEFHDANGDFVPDENPEFPGTGETRPSFPYNVDGANVCENCGGLPYVPIAEFYLDNGDGSVTQSLAAGSYGDPVANPYLATVDAATSTTVKEEVIPEPDPGGPCDPVEDPNSRRPSCAQLRTSSTGHFHDLAVVTDNPGTLENEGGINGGDAVEFTIDIANTSSNPEAFLTAFNYQTKRRGLADIGILDGYTQDRRDVRVDDTLPLCTSLDDAACFNASLGVGHFPNVIGNGLLFGQMVWTDNDAGREGPVIPDQVHVAESGINPVPYQLESVKKNGPFSPILKGNTNFICVKSGLFDNDPDADAGCAGEPAILANPELPPTPSNIVAEGPFGGRLGLPPGETQSVRMRMEWGDFRGAMLEIVAGTLTPDNVDPAHGDSLGLARSFDCSDQRELEYCHPQLRGQNIGYVPNTSATWLTPETLEEIEYVIINQPGDTVRVMNLQENLGEIMTMAGFVPSAEFYAPDPNPDLIGTPDEGVLIRQQVLGTYGMTEVDPSATEFTSTAVESATVGEEYVYDTHAVAYPGPVTYSLGGTAPAGMTIDGDTGRITWTPDAVGTQDVEVRASNGTGPDAVQAFTVSVALDSFTRGNGRLGGDWFGRTRGYEIRKQAADVNRGGRIYWHDRFGADQMAAMTLTKVHQRGGRHGLLLKARPDAGRMITVAYLPQREELQVSAVTPRRTSVLRTVAMALGNGDRLEARAFDDGKVRVFADGVRVASADAGAGFAGGGYIGAHFSRAERARFDDYTGGAVQ